MRVVVVTPVYEDWESFGLMVAELDRELAGDAALAGVAVGVLAVDDGSIASGFGTTAQWNSLSRIDRIDVLRLAMNMGHQRAIALGAVHAAAQPAVDAIVVMDADGEDCPKDVPRLLACHLADPDAIILARRDKRSESLEFRLGYWVYRRLFRQLAGHELAFGNFSLVPRRALLRLVWNSDIWNHFAAAVSRSRLPVRMLPTVRGRRYAGQGKMNGVSLVVHGLSAMSVHADRIAARLILASVVVLVCSLSAIGIVVAIRLLTDLAIPGWASQVVGTFALLSLVSVGFATLLAFSTLQSRQSSSFIPAVDGERYIREIETWHPLNATTTSAAN